MDNHFHLVVQTGKDPKILQIFMHRISTSLAIIINRKYQRVGHLFQDRYNANYLEYKKDVIRALNYIKQNPVREGIVRKAEGYPWCKGKKGGVMLGTGL